MINLEKKSKMTVEEIYCLHVNDYYADYAIEDECEPQKGGFLVTSISKENFELLEEAGAKTEHYFQIVFAKTENVQDTLKIRQMMHKHIVYVDRADHTNF